MAARLPCPSDATLYRWLARAIAAGLVCQEGTGRKANPFRYWLPGCENEWLKDPRYAIEQMIEEDRRLRERYLGRGWKGRFREAAPGVTLDLVFGAFGDNLGYNSGMANSTTISDADILEHVVSAVKGGFVPDVARALLELRFDRNATKRVRQLLQKNNRGTISAEERITLEKFLRVGKFIDLLQAKARLSLKEAGLSS